MFNSSDIVRFKDIHNDNRYRKIVSCEWKGGDSPYYLTVDVKKGKNGGFSRVDDISSPWNKELFESLFDKVN